jgi:hypothetical protein
MKFCVEISSGLYVVCLKSKCTDFPMDELVMKHLVDVYQHVGSDLGCIFKLVSAGLVASVTLYCCLRTVVFYNLVTFAIQKNTE